MNVQNDEVMTVSQQNVLLLKDGKEGGRRQEIAAALELYGLGPMRLYRGKRKETVNEVNGSGFMCSDRWIFTATSVTNCIHLHKVKDAPCPSVITAQHRRSRILPHIL